MVGGMARARAAAETIVAEGGVAGPFNSNLCWLLARGYYTLTTEIAAELQAVDLTPRMHEVLVAAADGDYTQTELVRMVGLDKTTMVVTLDELEAAGLAERRPSRTDRRARVIAVTRAGRRKLAQADEIMHRVHADVLGVLPARDRRIFMASLKTLVGGRLAEPVASAPTVRRRAVRG